MPNAERTREAQDLGTVLAGLLGERPWRAGMAVAALVRGWGLVVGERLAEESRPASLDRGVLTIKASSSAWGAQIRFLTEEIARRANEVLGPGSVASIRVLIEPTVPTDRPGRPRPVSGDR